MLQPKPVIITPKIAGMLVLLELSRLAPGAVMEDPGETLLEGRWDQDGDVVVKDPDSGLKIRVIMQRMDPTGMTFRFMVLGRFMGIAYSPCFFADRDELCVSVRHFNEKYTKPVAALMANYLAPLQRAPLSADFSYMG